MQPHTWTELQPAVLDRNIRALRDALTPGAEIVFVVKSDAYGHGMANVARQAWASGIRTFAVAHLEEGLELRAVTPDAQILVLGPIDPARAADALAERLTATLVSESHATALADAVGRIGGVLPCHVKIDTGMGRLGFDWESAADAVARIAGRRELSLDGIYSHFASGGSPDRAVACEQAKRFQAVVEACESRGIRIPLRHMSNSGAVQRDPGLDLNAVRTGILLYGYSLARQFPGASIERSIDVQPILQWKTRVVQVKSVGPGIPVSYDGTGVTEKSTRVATVSVGYADGYPRALSNRGHMVIRGRHRPVLGRVTMNFVMVDVGEGTDVREGDTAVLLGDDGGVSVWADDLATWCGTIPYEILTGIRVKERRVV